MSAQSVGPVLLVGAYVGELGDAEGVAVGIGPLQASVGTAALILRQRPSALVITGSAGAYGDIPVGDVVLASRVGQADHGVLAGLSYEPVALPQYDVDNAAWASWGLREASVLCLSSITTSHEMRDKLVSSWQVEHMECYAIMAAAQHFEVPCYAVLGIANRVGPRAHEEWLRYHSQAELAARTTALRLIDALRRT